MSLLGIDAIAVELENPFGDKTQLGSGFGLESFRVLAFRVLLLLVFQGLGF